MMSEIKWNPYLYDSVELNLVPVWECLECQRLNGEDCKDIIEAVRCGYCGAEFAIVVSTTRLVKA